LLAQLERDPLDDHCEREDRERLTEPARPQIGGLTPDRLVHRAQVTARVPG
jgi:hypothetical protein